MQLVRRNTCALSKQMRGGVENLSQLMYHNQLHKLPNFKCKFQCLVNTGGFQAKRLWAYLSHTGIPQGKYDDLSISCSDEPLIYYHIHQYITKLLLLLIKIGREHGKPIHRGVDLLRPPALGKIFKRKNYFILSWDPPASDF